MDAKIISRTNPNPFFIIFAQNIYQKSNEDFDRRILLIDMHPYAFTPICMYLKPLL